MTDVVYFDAEGLWDGKRAYAGPPEPEQVERARAWLAAALEPGGRWLRRTSYGLKHDAETWHREPERAHAYRNNYISNGALIAAAFEVGFAMRPVDDLNVVFRVRSCNPVEPQVPLTWNECDERAHRAFDARTASQPATWSRADITAEVDAIVRREYAHLGLFVEGMCTGECGEGPTAYDDALLDEIFSRFPDDELDELW